MITINAKFPESYDAYDMRHAISELFDGYFESQGGNIEMSPVRKIMENDKYVWTFTIKVYKIADDNTEEKTLDISGGTFNLISGNRKVWAFS